MSAPGAVAAATLALGAAWATALCLLLLVGMVPAFPRPEASLDGPLTSGAFLVSAIPTALALLLVAGLVLALLPDRLPLRIERRHLRETAAATAALLALNVAGSFLLRLRGEPYHGMPLLDGPGEAAAVLASAALLAPVAEEAFFREALLARIFAGRPRTGALLTSLAFGLVHASVGGPVAVLTLAAMGGILAAVRLRTGSLGPPILAHAAQNALALALALAGGNP